MSTIEALIVEQTSIFLRIKDAFSNYEKKYRSKMFEGSFSARIDTLKNIWKTYQSNDHNINSLKKDEHNSQDYFTNANFCIAAIEEFYTDEYSKFLKVKSQSAPLMSPGATYPQSNNINIHELPRIEVPYFSGNFCDGLNSRIYSAR